MIRNANDKLAATKRRHIVALSCTAIAVAVIVAAADFQMPLHVRAGDDDRNEWKVERGFVIAPVHLNLAGKDRYLVGLGSYIVNAQIDCNGCHTQNTATEFLPAGNPYFLPSIFRGRKEINAATYLGGGNDFGPLIPGSAHIISRNLTPDKTGRPEGGHTFAEFRENPAHGCRLRPPSPHLLRCAQRKLCSAAIRRRSPPDHAVASL